MHPMLEVGLHPTWSGIRILYYVFRDELYNFMGKGGFFLTNQKDLMEIAYIARFCIFGEDGNFKESWQCQAPSGTMCSGFFVKVFSR